MLYHAIFGPERLEETVHNSKFASSWQDRFRITAILGAHLGIVGTAAILFYLKATVFGGLYDTSASGGGNFSFRASTYDTFSFERALIKDIHVTYNPYVLGRYLPRAPYGSEGWIISINNMEDLIGGHYWVGISSLIGGVWHICTRPFPIIVRGFTWSGEAYLS